MINYVIKLLWTFKGKIDRLEYIWAVILAYPLLVICFLIIDILPAGRSPTLQLLIATIYLTGFTNYIYIHTAIICKRLRDIGWNLWLTPVFLIPLLGFLGMAFIPSKKHA